MTLQVVGNTGNFVRANQEMASQEGFASVSKKWLDTTITFEDFLNKLEDERRQRVDIKATPAEVNVEVEEGQVKFNIRGTKFSPTLHAFKQSCLWMDTPQTLLVHYTQPKVLNDKVKYQRDERDAHILRSALALGLSRLDQDKTFLFRTYTDGTLRAMLSELYKTIDNRWFLEVLRDLCPDARVSHFDRSDCDTLMCNILYPDSVRDDDDSSYGLLSWVSNCELGTRRLESYPSVFRAICMNGCVWDRTDGLAISMVHRGKTVDLNSLRDKIAKNIHDQVPLRQEIMDRFFGLRRIDLNTTVENVIAQVAVDNTLTPKQAKEILNQYQTHESHFGNMFGIVNAVTRAGQVFNRDVWHDFDLLGGKFMSMTDNQIGAFLGRAKNISPEKVNKVLGLELAV